MVGRRLLELLGALVIPATLLVAPIAVLSGTADSASPTAVRRGESLPPAGRRELAAIFGPQVRKLGLRVTRAALVDRKQKRNSRGTHLAIYVEPVGDYTTQNYVDGTVAVTRVFLPSVFERWKDLRSFDVCQEPPPSDDDRVSPPPVTQVFATRAGSRLVDWSAVDVASMVATSERESDDAGMHRPAEFSLYVAKHLTRTPEFQQAVGSSPGVSASTPPTSPAYG